mgnify:CR=1 FL=1
MAELEQSGLCDDDMQEQGVSKVLTINLNNMARELDIEWRVSKILTVSLNDMAKELDIE